MNLSINSNKKYNKYSNSENKIKTLEKQIYEIEKEIDDYMKIIGVNELHKQNTNSNFIIKSSDIVIKDYLEKIDNKYKIVEKYQREINIRRPASSREASLPLI